MTGLDGVCEGFSQAGFDAGVRERFLAWQAAGGTVPGLSDGALLPDGALEVLALRHGVAGERLARLRAAMAHLSKLEDLRTLTRFLAFDLCTDRNRYDGSLFNNPEPEGMGRFKALYPLLLCLTCMPVSHAMCDARGIPAPTYLAVAERALGPQMRRYADGRDTIVDFPWDLNFYTGSIFLIGRFSYIATPYDDDVDFWRNRRTGQVLGLFDGERLFRRDGQFQGINGVEDSRAFRSVRRQTGETVTANPVNPMGFLEPEPMTLALSEWSCVLRRGDWTLGFHIPSGPGYDPEHLLPATQEAFAFFDRHFPEWPVRGLWSESWLYDARLSLCMAPERNIVRMQRQMYLYPMDRGDDMLRLELFGNELDDPAAFEPKTGLQRAALAYMKAGGRFNTGGMVILRGEAERIGDMPYIRPEDIIRFRGTVDRHLDMKQAPSTGVADG